MLRAPLATQQGLVAYSARDEFNGSGALTGRVATVGGTWTVVTNSDTDDYTVSGGVAARSTTATDTGTGTGVLVGRGVTAGTTSYTSIVTTIDMQIGAIAGGVANGICNGALFRVTNSSNYGCAYISWSTGDVRLERIVAGAIESNVLETVSIAANAWYRLIVAAYATGVVKVWFSPRDSVPTLRGTYYHPDFAAGTLASGRIGIFEFLPAGAGAGATRSADNFAAWVPTQDAVIFASRSLQLATDAAVREASGGTAYGPVSLVERDLPRLPPSGLEQRPVQMMFKPSRGDFEETPDSGIDDVSVRGYYRRCWLFVPDESFNPLDLVTEGVTTVEMWLRPEALGAAGSSVATWFDSSGSGNNAAQSTGSLQPTVVANVLDGYRAVSGDNVDDVLTFTLPADASRTFYFVARATATPSNDKLFFGTANCSLNGNGTDMRYALDSVGGQRSFGDTVTNWNLYVVRVNSAASLDIFLNGGSATNFDPNNDVTTDTTFGLLNNTGGGEPWPGYLAEVLIVGSALDATSHDRVRGYFSRKYPTLGSFGT